MECDAMPTVHLTCPRCTRNLRCQRLIAPGERLRCPHCSGQFRAGLEEAPRLAATSQTEPRSSRGILLAWLLFANLLVLGGGGFAIAVAFSNRARSEDAAPHEPRATDTLVAEAVVPSPRIELPATPASAPPAPNAPPSKPAPLPDPPRTPPADPPKPPPLPVPSPRPAEPKPPEPEKLHAPAPPRRAAPQVLGVPPQIQKEIDGGIDRGVEFLRRRQRADGSWGHQTGIADKRFTPGITALSGLTLLECGVPANDPQVRATARYLRQRMPELTTTYSISVAILFFDRLGDPADAARIRTLALRLIAGQKTSGGWDYYCPMLNEDEELGLLALLYKDRPTSPLDLFAVERKTEPLEGEPSREKAKLDTDLYRPRPSKVPPLELFLSQGAAVNARPAERKAEPAGRTEESEAAASKPEAPRRAAKLPESLRRIPALHAAELLRTPPDLSEPRTDNSNTQFAILGLLTAENHDVPMERAMTLLDWRFRNSLTAQGGWNYRPKWQTTPSMTAAALMGLALKHGLLLPNRRERGRNVAVHDELIQHGFATLNGLLENYLAGFFFQQTRLEKLDLYCLWTVERVAVLYNVRTLGTLEWYPAGVQLLLPMQRDDGSWGPAGTTCLEEPSVATSFALLFLKRSNLARDLTERLNAPEN
jgi:hypothetical protein